MGALAAGSPSDIREQLAGLLDRAISPRQFWHWFVDAESAIELHGSDDEVDLAELVDNRFAEWTSGYVTSEQLLAALAADLGRRVGPIVGPSSHAVLAT